MADIWQQFHQLPRQIRDAVATPQALATVDQLEQDYPQLDVATLIMRVMVKEVPLDALADTIVAEGVPDRAAAEQIATTLRAEVFHPVLDFLGVVPAAAPPSKPPAARRVTPIAPTPTPESVPPLTPVVEEVSMPLPTAAAPVEVAIPTVPGKPLPPRPPIRSQVRPVPVIPPPAPAVRIPAPVTAAPAAAVIPPAPPGPVVIPRVPKVPTPPPDQPGAPTGPVAPTQAYSEEDAKEIEQQTKRLEQINTATPVMDFETMANETLKQHQLGFPDDRMTKRAIAIFKARLKEIRNSDDTVDVLTRDPKVGGLGLDRDLAEQIVATLDQQATVLKSRGMVRPPEPIPPPVPPAVPKVQAERPEPKPPLQTVLPPPNLPVAAAPLPNVTDAPRPSRPIRRPADIPAPPSLPTPAPAPVAVAPTPAPTVQRGRVMDRPQVADITQPNRTYGPAEEIRSLSVADFRRLGQGANDSVRRLMEKFQRLQNESFRLWAEAQAGWRQSDVYQLYLSMGRESLEDNQPITEVIKRRAQHNQPYLSEHEFSAIADFNRQLHP